MSQTEYVYPDYYYYPAPNALPARLEPASRDYRKLAGCLWVLGIACGLAGMIYFVSGDQIISGALVGLTILLLVLYHVPFGLFILFSLFAIENALVLSPYFTISKAMGIVVAVSFILHSFRDKLVVTTPIMLVAALTAWALASTLWAVDSRFAAVSSLTLLLNAGIVLIVLNSIKDSKCLYLVLGGLIAGALVTSVMVSAGLTAQSSDRLIQRATLNEETGAVGLALAIGMGFLATSYTFFQKGYLKKILAGACLVLFFVALVKTQSRMPTLASLSAPILALILASKREHRIKYLILAVVAALFAYVAVQAVLQSDMLNEVEKRRIFEQDLAQSGRLRVWAEGLKVFAARPLHGCGANNHFVLSGFGGMAIHNTWIAFAADLGLVGLGLILTVFLLVYCRVRSLSDIRLKWLGFAMLIYPLMTGMTYVNYMKREFWYSLAIAMATAQIGRLEQLRQGGRV